MNKIWVKELIEQQHMVMKHAIEKGNMWSAIEAYALARALYETRVISVIEHNKMVNDAVIIINNYVLNHTQFNFEDEGYLALKKNFMGGEE